MYIEEINLKKALIMSSCLPEYCLPEVYGICDPECDSDGGCDPHYDNV